MQIPKELADLVINDPFAENRITKTKLDSMNRNERNKIIISLFRQLHQKNAKLDEFLKRYGGVNGINCFVIGNGRILAVGQSPEEFSDEYLKQLSDKIDGGFIYLCGGEDIIEETARYSYETAKAYQ